MKNNNLVKITAKLAHYAPCSVSREREQGWSTERVYEWGKVVAFAKETINIDDQLVLLGILKAFQENPYNIKEGELREDKPTSTLTMSLDKLMKDYLKTHNRKFVEESLTRLISWKVIFSYNKGVVNPQEYLVDFKIFIEDGIFKVTLTINKNFYQACIKQGLLLDYYAIKKLKSNIAKAIYMYIGAKSTPCFYQDTIEKALDMDKTNMKSWDKREKIKEALEILKKNDLITHYTCEKKDGDYLFTIVKRQLIQKDQQELSEELVHLIDIAVD